MQHIFGSELLHFANWVSWNSKPLKWKFNVMRAFVNHILINCVPYFLIAKLLQKKFLSHRKLFLIKWQKMFIFHKVKQIAKMDINIFVGCCILYGGGLWPGIVRISNGWKEVSLKMVKISNGSEIWKSRLLKSRKMATIFNGLGQLYGSGFF